MDMVSLPYSVCHLHDVFDHYLDNDVDNIDVPPNAGDDKICYDVYHVIEYADAEHYDGSQFAVEMVSYAHYVVNEMYVHGGDDDDDGVHDLAMLPTRLVECA